MMNALENWKFVWTFGLVASCIMPLILYYADILFFDKRDGNKYFLITVAYILISVFLVPVAILFDYTGVLTYCLLLISGFMVGSTIGILLKKLERKYKRT